MTTDFLENYNGIEKAASGFRGALGLTDVPFLDVLTVLNKMKAQFGIDWVTAAEKELELGTLARWDSSKRLITISPSAFADTAFWRANPRGAFTIVHECVHAFIGDEGTHHRSVSREMLPTFATNLRNNERYVDQVTAAILAPEKYISDSATVKEVADKFGISHTAAEIRLNDVLRAKRLRKNEGRSIPSDIAWKIEELRNGFRKRQ